jgi:TonB family protein
MRPTIIVPLALLALPLAAALPAQADLVHQEMTNQRAAFSRRCDTPKIEMIDAQLAATDAVSAPKGFLEHVDNAVFFYFSPVEWRTPRFALAQMTLHRDGSVSGAQLVTPSGMAAFDSAITQAISSAVRARAFGALPPAVAPDSLVLSLYVGRHANAGDKPYLEKRTTCPAWPSSHNPTPEYPVDMKQQNVRGYVDAQFMVNEDGKIDPSSVQILRSSGDAFTKAVRDVLPTLRYEPATVQGKKVPQLTQQTFTFGFVDHPAQ